jgi:hypothetical protein
VDDGNVGDGDALWQGHEDVTRSLGSNGGAVGVSAAPAARPGSQQRGGSRAEVLPALCTAWRNIPFRMSCCSVNCAARVEHHAKIVVVCSTIYNITIYVKGDTRPTGALPPRLPVSVRRSASLAKCSALLKGDGSQVNGLRRWCCEGVMFLDWSNVCFSVLLYYYCVQSGMLHV